MTHFTAFLLCLLAFTALALAMERQQKDIFERPLSSGTTRLLRIVGWGALVVALWLVVERQGWALGLVSYSGYTSVGAGLVYVVLIFRARRGVR
jgi:hypothetical protein